MSDEIRERALNSGRLVVDMESELSVGWTRKPCWLNEPGLYIS